MENETLKSDTADSKSTVKTPDIKALLEAGVQFGHEVSKWNPKMKDYIFGSKNKIHIIDVQKTMTKLDEAVKFIFEKAQKGNILFVATKRQAREIVKNVAIESGSFFIVNRWPGGLLTNMKMVKKSYQQLRKIEEEFESGVANRTKYEVTLLKKTWDRMNKLYGGVKTMEKYPEAIIIVDSNYEKGCIEEAKRANIPVVALTDTNCDPMSVDFPIPANDDAIKSITLILSVLSEAIKKGNGGKGIVHNLKDYSNFEVQIIKKEEKEEVATELKLGEETRPILVKETRIETVKGRSKDKKGILEQVKDMAQEEKKPVKSVQKSELKPQKESKTVEVKKAVKKVKQVLVKKKPVKNPAVKKTKAVKKAI